MAPGPGNLAVHARGLPLLLRVALLPVLALEGLLALLFLGLGP